MANLIFSSIVVTAALLFFSPQSIQGHGQLFDPPNRSSLWRFPEFVAPSEDGEYSEVQPDYDDIEHYCGGMAIQHNQNGGKCGVCGDPWHQPEPRDLEDGGKFATGIVVRNYTAGQVAHIKVYMDKAHWGYFELRICQRDSLDVKLTQECFDKNLLTFSTKRKLSSTKYQIVNGESQYYINTGVVIPNIKCSRCVMQWHYVAGNNWGKCSDGSYAQGCGPQETFRGCADISIS